MGAQPGSGGTNRARALGIAILFAGAMAVAVWWVADDAGLTMGDIAAPALIGGAIGLVLTVFVAVLAMSRFRASFSRIRTPSALFLGGLGLWAWLLLQPGLRSGLS